MGTSTTAQNHIEAPDDVCIRMRRIFFTERLILRPLYRSDAPALFKACTSDPEVTRYLTWTTHVNVSETDEYIKQCHENGGQAGFVWAVVLKDRGELAGLVDCRIQEGAAALGYLFSRGCWGKGYAKEAVGAVTDWLETIRQLTVLWAYCDTENASSKGLLARLGFKFYCVMPEKIICPALSESEREAHCFTRAVPRITMPQQDRRASA